MKQLENKAEQCKTKYQMGTQCSHFRNTLILIIGSCYIRFFILVVIRIIMIHYNENFSFQNAFTCIISLTQLQLFRDKEVIESFMPTHVT